MKKTVKGQPKHKSGAETDHLTQQAKHLGGGKKQEITYQMIQKYADNA